MTAWSTTTRVRKDTGYWARFWGLNDHIVGSGPPWMLSVESSDGRWYGETLVNSVDNTSPMDVAIELEPLASLAFRVTDPEGCPKPEST